MGIVLTHTSIAVHDVKEEFAFFEKYLGLIKIAEINNPPTYWIGDGISTHQIALLQEGRVDASPWGGNHLGFVIETREELNALYAKAQKEDPGIIEVALVEEGLSAGCIFVLLSPSGHHIEFSHGQLGGYDAEWMTDANVREARAKRFAEIRKHSTSFRNLQTPSNPEQFGGDIGTQLNDINKGTELPIDFK